MGFFRATFVPCIFALAAWYCIVPGYFYVYGDPDFGYLMNSLRITEGLYAWHVDHPGSILQLIGAAVIEIVKFIKHEPDGLQALVTNLDLIYYCTLAVSLATLLGAQFLLGWMLLRRGYGFLVAMAAQLTPALFTDVPMVLVRLNSETTMAAAGLFVAAAFLPFLEPSHKKNRRHLILLGCAIGAAMATKANVWPIALLALVPLFAAEKSIKDSLTIMASTVFVFVVITIPAWPRYGYLFNWIVRLFVHSGLYGSGPVQITSINDLKNAFSLYTDLVTDRPQIIAVVLTLVLILVALRQRVRIYFPVLAAFLLIGFFILKHPGTRYSIAFVPVVAIAILFLARLPGAFRISLATLLVLLAADGLLMHSRPVHDIHLGYVRQGQLLSRELNGPHATCAVVMMEQLPIPEASFMEGHSVASADYPWPDRMKALFPRYFLLRDNGAARFNRPLFPIDSKAMTTWLSEVSHFPCQVFVASTWRKWALPFVQNNFSGEFLDVEANVQPKLFFMYRHEGELSSHWSTLVETSL